MASSPTTNEKVLHDVQFREDVCKTCWPLCCGWSFTALISTIGIVCMPCIPCVACKYVKSQKAMVTDRHLKFKSGVLTIEDRTIPLDRIQDMRLVSGICDRVCGVQSVVVETAGNSAGVSEARIYAPVDPMTLRKVVMEQRDKIALGNDGVSNSVSLSGKGNKVSPMDTDKAVLEELREIREAVKKIEGDVSKAVNK